MTVALILTKDEYSYEQWLRLVNNGKDILEKDRVEFPRITTMERARTFKKPLPLVYTWGSYFINDKMERLYRDLEAYGFKIIPSPTEGKIGART